MKHKLVATGSACAVAVGLLTAMSFATAANGDQRGANTPPPHVHWLANVTVVCDPMVMTAKMDPIVFPNVPAGPDNPSHLHQFYGNLDMSLGGDSTPASLEADQSSTCIGPHDPRQGGPAGKASPATHLADGSSYWTPALYANGNMNGMVGMDDPMPMIPIGAHTYYRNGGLDPTVVMPWPDDMEMIAGNSKATSEQTGIVEWACTQGTIGETTVPHGLPQTFNAGPTIPASCPMRDSLGPIQLKLTVFFPNCFHPITATAPKSANYTSRMSYALPNNQPGRINAYCPAGTTPIPQLTVVVRWLLDSAEEIPNDGTNWDLSALELSSDGMNGAGIHGMTAHADFMDGWHADDVADLVENCFAPPYPHNCGLQ